jgi:FMN phosphatase YigB (HAD superfamily)
MQFDVRAYELEGLLDRMPEGVEVLSLDCFDTLIWRSTSAPIDVFADLTLPDSSMGGRMLAEHAARLRAMSTTGAKEIHLREVYQFHYPSADAETIQQAVAHELAQERKHAFAFAPTVALIREAKRRRLKIVIVSDMYWSEAELSAHIAGIAGEDVLASIDRIFVSSEFGVGKCDGLFKNVLAELNVSPAAILHVGDNYNADYTAPARLGIHAVHLRQFEPEAEQRLRMEAASAIMLDPAARATRPICQMHRAQIALRHPCEPAIALGHDVMGPVMHSFALWLKAELDDASAALGKPVRPLFVMRDGYLPFLAFDKMYPDAGAAKVELSRYVAFRASIQDAAALDSYLTEWATQLPVHLMARQLMLLKHEYAKFVKGDTEEELRFSFARAVRRPELRSKIVNRCRAFTQKLVAHLNGLGVGAGDAVMLVDIGYNGTVQNILTPVLRECLNLDVLGRYLFLRETQLTSLDKRGMLDLRNYDFRALHALSSSVIVIEQLCNIAQGSTVDLAEDGNPIREGLDAKAAHSRTRDEVQAACLSYIEEAGKGLHRAPASDTLDVRCRAAAASLARLFFLPSATEVKLFEQFDFDMNMGTASSQRLIDRSSTDRDLRRRGVSFGSGRGGGCFFSAELQGQGLPTGLGMFAAARFDLDMRLADYESGGIDVPVIAISGADHLLTNYTASRTVDGYYRLQLPIASAQHGVGIQLGQLCSWVQIEALEATPMSDLDKPLVQKRAIAVTAVPDGMEQVAPDLYRLSPEGLLFVSPLAIAEPVLLSLVFRPIRGRDEAVALRTAA